MYKTIPIGRILLAVRQFKNANIKKTVTLTNDQAQQRHVFDPSFTPVYQQSSFGLQHWLSIAVRTMRSACLQRFFPPNDPRCGGGEPVKQHM